MNLTSTEISMLMICIILLVVQVWIALVPFLARKREEKNKNTLSIKLQKK